MIIVNETQEENQTYNPHKFYRIYVNVASFALSCIEIYVMNDKI